MIKAIIIDDERQSRNLMRKMLVDYCEDVTVIGEANGVTAGIELLKKEQPNVLLLDVEMSDGNGFDILNEIDSINFSVIFVTGYDHYAIKAIKYAALDYLLKPVNLEELKLAINKLRNGSTGERDKLRFFQSHFENRKKKLSQIVLPGRDSHVVVELENIIRIEAKGSYVIHKSHLINLYKVSLFGLGKSGKVLLKDGAELDVAARRRSAFNQVMKQLG